MSDVFYTPPAADLQPITSDDPEFFTVAPRKLIVMMLLTHGLYGAYWLYQNWKHYKIRSGRPIWPLARTILALFYVPSLFCKIDRACKSKDERGMPHWCAIGILYIFLPLAPFIIGMTYGVYRGVAGFDSAPVGFWFEFLTGTAVFVFQSLIVLRVQRFINQANEDPNGQANERYSSGNAIWIFVGMLIWLWMTIGMYITSQP